MSDPACASPGTDLLKRRFEHGPEFISSMSVLRHMVYGLPVYLTLPFGFVCASSANSAYVGVHDELLMSLAI